MDSRHRRDKLSKSLKGGLIVASAYDALQLSGDMAGPFLQESNFWWLTNIAEPSWRLIIEPGPRGVRATLVRPLLSTTQKLFDGEIDEQSMKKTSGITKIIEANDFEQYLRHLAKKHTVVYTPYTKAMRYDFVHNPAQKELHAQLERIFTSVVDCTQDISRLRAVKTSEEIEAIKKAVRVTRHAFESVRAQLETYQHEYEIEADITRIFRRANAIHAYDPIIASGPNAVTLHYTKNNAKVGKKQLLLIDVGARVDGYAADVTRTYCLRPSKRQKSIHAAVLQAEEKIIALLEPGLAVAHYVEMVDAIMKDALMSLGLLKDRQDGEAYRRYFPHAVSHGLGIDVHDSLGAPLHFVVGMVVTVEPGIYIPEEGIGVRIEDDVLITEGGCINLSGGLSTAL